MRPVLLKFSGLHSYRREQVIDFAELAVGGLFGIFGPTGSGKSTILDAVTLALYGNVERALRGIQGIINQNEDRLEVSFEFELGGERYTVQRLYEKGSDDPNSARSKYARLFKQTDRGEEVIASGVGDTNSAVEELLGLDANEFSRAVVLPQGKFDQFLKLTGGERAKMLEHIFCLERFGEELSRKARALIIECDHSLATIQAEQAGLGECSDEAISKAEEELREREAAVSALTDQLKKLTSQLEEQKELKQLVDEEKGYLKEKASLDERQQEMSDLREKWNDARQAAPLEAYVRQLKELQGRLASLSRELKGKKEELDKAEAEFSGAAKELSVLEEKQDRELPDLIKRQSELEAILGKTEELKKLQKQVRNLSSGVEQHKREVEELSKQEKKQVLLVEEANNQYKALAAERSDKRVDPKERQRIQQALQALAELNRAKEDVENGEQVLLKRKQAVQQVEQELAEVLKREMSPEELSERDQVLPLVKKHLEQAREELRKSEEAQRQAFVREKAQVLAKELEEGKPCPVCGSVHHPNLAAGVAGLADKAQQRVELARVRLDEVSDWSSNVQAVCERLEHSRTELAEDVKKVDTLKQILREAGDKFTQIWDGTAEALQHQTRELEQADVLLAKLDEQIDELEAERTGMQEELDQMREKLRILEGETTKQVHELKTIHDRVADLEDEIKKIAGDGNPEDLLAEVKNQIAGLKEQVTKARERMETDRVLKDELSTNVTALESTIETLENDLQTTQQNLERFLRKSKFSSAAEVEQALLDKEKQEEIERQLEEYEQKQHTVSENLKRLAEKINGREFDQEQFKKLGEDWESLDEELKQNRDALAVVNKTVADLKARQKRWAELQDRAKKVEHRGELARELSRLLQGRKLVQFLAEEHLRDMVTEASRELGKLSVQRYALELGDGLEFVVRDDYNGGQRRPVSTLSGGETFMTSLALALALSSKIQLKGQYPLGFFFLDEGFGTLDEEKLDLVVSTLERLHNEERMVGVISHVKELRERLPRYLDVTPTAEDGRGSSLRLSVN